MLDKLISQVNFDDLRSLTFDPFEDLHRMIQDSVTKEEQYQSRTSLKGK